MKTDNIKNKMWQICRAALVATTLLIVANCTEEEPAETLYAPSLENQGATNLARTSVTLTGRITGNINAITEYGFKCSTSEAFPNDQTIKVIVDSPVSTSPFSAEVNNLNPNQHYYYCLYATTGTSTMQADAGEFTTISTATPTFGALSIDSIGENVIRLKCSVEEIGDNFLIEYGVSYKTEASNTFIPVAAESFTNNSTREYMVTITGLQAETRYIVRPYAKNSSTQQGEQGVLEGYGEQQLITTESLLSPEVTTKELGNPGINAITISGVVTAATGSDGVIDECGFCWSSTNSEPTILDDTIRVTTKALNTTFTATVENLQARTQYYIRAYSKNTVNGVERYGYGEVRTFQTTSLVTPELTIDEASTTATSITATASISNYDASALIEKGFIWSRSNAQVELGDDDASSLKVETGENFYNATINNLTINQRYYLRAYAIYEASGVQQTGYSDYISLSTEEFRTVSLDINVTETTYNSVTVQGIFLDWGNVEVIEKGFCWIEGNLTPTIENGNKHLIEEDDFNMQITGLKFNSYYRVRAYAICKIGDQQEIAYSDSKGFNTDNMKLVSFDGINITDITYNSAKVQTAITDWGNVEVIEKGFCWIEDSDPTLENASKIIIEGSDLSTEITGLKFNSHYRVRAYAICKLEDVTETTYSGTYGFYIPTPQQAEISWDRDWNKSTAFTNYVTARILKEGDFPTTEVGVYWRIGHNWDNFNYDNCDGKTALTLNEDGTYSGAFPTLPGQNYVYGIYSKMNLDGMEIICPDYGGRGGLSRDLTVENFQSDATGNSFTVSAIIKELEYAVDLQEVGFAYLERSDVEDWGTATKVKCEVDENGFISTTVNDLPSGVSYHVRPYVVLNEEIFLADDRWGISTRRAPQEDDNASPDKTEK